MKAEFGKVSVPEALSAAPKVTAVPVIVTLAQLRLPDDRVPLAMLRIELPTVTVPVVYVKVPVAYRTVPLTVSVPAVLMLVFIDSVPAAPVHVPVSPNTRVAVPDKLPVVVNPLVVQLNAPLMTLASLMVVRPVTSRLLPSVTVWVPLMVAEAAVMRKAPVNVVLVVADNVSDVQLTAPLKLRVPLVPVIAQVPHVIANAPENVTELDAPIARLKVPAGFHALDSV